MSDLFVSMMEKAVVKLTPFRPNSGDKVILDGILYTVEHLYFDFDANIFIAKMNF